ncbi:MAG TPA: MEDS domain-containing protein [Trebonia sp.]|nr:MEDS domain-containing protein [Trebonia sp.]
MSSGSRSAPAVGVDRLQPGDHAFLAFSDDEERWEILSTFTRQGLAREEKVFLLLDVRSSGEAAARVAGSAAAARRAVDDGRLVVSNAPGSTRAEFTGALRALAARPESTLVLDIADLSFLDAYSVNAILRLAAGLTPPRRLEVRCRHIHRRMLHALGGRLIAQLSVVTERL